MRVRSSRGRERGASVPQPGTFVRDAEGAKGLPSFPAVEISEGFLWVFVRQTLQRCSGRSAEKSPGREVAAGALESSSVAVPGRASVALQRRAAPDQVRAQGCISPPPGKQPQDPSHVPGELSWEAGQRLHRSRGRFGPRPGAFPPDHVTCLCSVCRVMLRAQLASRLLIDSFMLWLFTASQNLQLTALAFFAEVRRRVGKGGLTGLFQRNCCLGCLFMEETGPGPFPALTELWLSCRW